MEYNLFQNNRILDLVSKKSGWNLCKLIDLFTDDTKNATKIKKEVYLNSGKYPIVDQGKAYIAGYTNVEDGIYKEHPIIIFGDHTRIIKYIDNKVFIGADGVKILKSNFGAEIINVKYIYYYLNSIELPNDGYSRHFKYLREVIVPVPSIRVQNQIVKVLDKSKELIYKKKSQIREFDKLIKSQFVEMFGDPIINSKKFLMKPLGEICDMKAGKSIKAKDIYEYCDNNMYPCYGGNGLRGYCKTYTHEGRMPLIGRQGALCGNVKYAKGKFYATEHAVVTKPKVKMNSCWLYIMLREMNLNRLASGAAQPGLNVSTLVNMEVIVPPIELQNQFADFVKKVDKLKVEAEKSLKEMENNFNSLMQRAFKGELFN